MKKKSLKGKDFGDKDLNALFQKIYEMNDDIRDQVDKITEKSGISKKELYAYFDNPSNFTQEELQKFDREREELEKKLIPVMGVAWKRRRVVRRKKALLKKRKGKTLGGRKGWISMH